MTITGYGNISAEACVPSVRVTLSNNDFLSLYIRALSASITIRHMSVRIACVRAI